MNDEIEFDLDIQDSPAPPNNSYSSNNNNNNNNNNQQQQASLQQHTQHPEDLLSPLEQEVLDEYGKLVGNLDELSEILAELASRPSAEILDALRGLERKTTTVFTLLKASVYSIVLQQGMM